MHGALAGAIRRDIRVNIACVISQSAPETASSERGKEGEQSPAGAEVCAGKSNTQVCFIVFTSPKLNS